MLTTQKNQKMQGFASCNNLIAISVPKGITKLNHLIYVSCLCIIILLIGSLPGSAQVLPVTPISTTTTATPISTTTTTIGINTTIATGTSITLNGSTQCHMDDWTALKALYESTDGDNWIRNDGWDGAIFSLNKPPKICDLGNLEGVHTNDEDGRVISIAMPFNNLNGTLPDELGSLTYLRALNLSSNKLSGAIPNTLTNLNELHILVIGHNKLTGTIPDFQNFSTLRIFHNRFTCDEIEQFTNTLPINFNTLYSPQRIGHDHDPFIVDTNQVNSATYTFDWNSCNSTGRMAIPDQSGDTFRWVKNGYIDPNQVPTTSGQTATLHFDDVQPSDAGKYELYIYKDNVTIVSDPIYIIYPGYDFEGQPVESNQIMVEFDSPEATEYYEDHILFPNAGSPIDQCNCNRELYLWEFPDTEKAMDALIEIDGKNAITSNDDGEVDGGLNNKLSIAEPGIVAPLSYNIGLPPGYNSTGTDEVKIFMLDTGIEYGSCINNQYLYDNAPVDSCYIGDVTPASGYGYIDENGIDDNYQDDQGHGTFGYHLIKSTNSYNIKIVPLKIFNEEGQGNLFDMTCAVYHAIDHGANIINVSAGYYGQSSSIFEKAVKTALEQEVFICAAAGNEGINIDTLPQYPASYAGMYNYEYDLEGALVDSTRYSNVISVASIIGFMTTLDGETIVPDWSNVGAESVTLACYGQALNGWDLGCIPSVKSGTSMSSFVVSGLLAREIANNESRTMEQIWDDFDNSLLVSDNSLTQHTITGKRLRASLTPGSISILNEIRIGKTDSDLNARIAQSSAEIATLNYNMPDNGKMHINIYDVNGKYIQPLFNAPENKGKQQLKLSKSTLQPGIYFLHLHYQSDNGDEKYQVLKLPVLK